MSFVDEPVTGCERAVNGVLLSERFNLQENRSTGDPLKELRMSMSLLSYRGRIRKCAFVCVEHSGE